MNQSQGRFCRLYRPVGALLLLLPIVFLLLRSDVLQVPTGVVPTAVPTVAPTVVSPTAIPPTPVPVAAINLKVPSAADWTAGGLRLSGTGQPGATVEVWDGATRIGTAIVGADGFWNLLSSLSAGLHQLGVRMVDAAGNLLGELPASDIEVPAAVVVPTVTVPAAVAPPALNAPTAGDFTPDGARLRGTGLPGATVEVWDGATKIGAAVVGADGLWSLVSKLSAGAHQLALRMADAAGTTIGQSAAVAFAVPAGAVVTAAAEVTAAGVQLSGTALPGATLEVWDGATRVGTVTVGADGTWSLLSELAEGAYSLAVRVVDAAGNPLAESAAVDVTVPAGQGPAPVEDLAARGQEYIVQPGDWLINLAIRFYGDRELYMRIVDGTNAKAAVDSGFETIADPDRIRVGQKLWIPAAPGGK